VHAVTTGDHVFFTRALQTDDGRAGSVKTSPLPTVARRSSPRSRRLGSPTSQASCTPARRTSDAPD